MNQHNDRILYHYCSNEVLVNIIRGKQLWMTDISRSNDYNEMQMFIPGLYYAIEKEYINNPFPFKYKKKEDFDAIQLLLKDINDWTIMAHNTGFLTSYVVCFSEMGDVLSQWRGYANNGKGCSIGFSEKELQEYCIKQRGIIELRPVQYVDSKTINDIIQREAKDLIVLFPKIGIEAESIVSKQQIKELDTDGMILFLTLKIYCLCIYNSLQYKWDSYKEEKEWRLYFNSISKDDKTLFLPEDELADWNRMYNKEWTILHGKIEFIPKEDCLIPYYPIYLAEVSAHSIKEIITGPKNKTYIQDMRLLLAKANMGEVNIHRSGIAFR